MSDKLSSFGKKVFTNTTFAVIDLLLTKLGTTILFIILVRLLPASDIAAVGISMGYLVVIAYLEVGPIRVLLRDYPKIANHRYERDLLLSALMVFWIIQSLLMLVLCGALNWFILSKLGIPGLSFLFLGMTIDFIALAFQDWIKTIFYTSFQQSLATKISFLLILSRLTSYIILIFLPSLTNYTWILLANSTISCLVWGIVFKRRFNFQPIFDRSIAKKLTNSLNSYGLWDHLNRMTIDTIFTIDIVVLSWFGQIEEISNYTIALKVTSLFFLIPIQLHRSLQVVLSNYEDNKNRFNAINTFIKTNLLLSLAQLIFIIFGGNWLIYLLFGANTNDGVFEYTLIIAVGVTIMNLSWPVLSIINNFCRLHQAFLTVFLPTLLFGFIVYVNAAKVWGAIGVAYGNIIIYSFLTLGLVLFTKKQYPFPLKMRLLTSEEKQILTEIIKSKL